MQYCRLTANEKLPDRFLFSGLLKSPDDGLYLSYIIEITKPWFPTSRVAPVIINELKSNLSRLSGSSDLLASLEETLKDVNEALFDLSEQGETEWIGNLNSLIVLIRKNEIHLSQSGSLPGYLFRQQKINQITEGLALDKENHPLKTFSSIISGQVEKNDRLLLANHELFNVVSLDLLRQIVVSNSPYQSCLLLRRLIKKHNAPAVSVIVLSFNQQNPDEVGPDLVIVEESFEKWYRKVWRVSKPTIDKIWQTTRDGGKKAHKTYKEKISPRISSMTKKGLDKTKTSTLAAFQYSKEKVVPGIRSSIEKISKNPKTNQTDQVEQNLKEISPEVKELIFTDPTPKESLINLDFKNINKIWQNKKILYLLIGLIFISLALFLINNRQSSQKQETNQVDEQTILKKADDLIAKAVKAQEENNDDGQSVNSLTEAEKLLSQITDKDKLDEKKQRQEEIQANLDILTKTDRLKKSVNQYSFSDKTVNQIALISPYIFASSKDEGKIYRQAAGSLDSAKESELEMPEPIVRGVLDLFEDDQETAGSFKAMSGDNQIWQIKQNGADTAINQQKDTLGKFAAADYGANYLGNLYLLDSSTGLLWKYPKSSENNFGKGVNQIDINTINLKKSVSLTIDGFIYILKDDGRVVKLLKGLPQENFTLEKPPVPNPAIYRPLKIITSQTDDSLYILDAGKTADETTSRRILEYTKDGVFLKQYVFPLNLDNIKDVVLKIKEKKLWLLNDNKVYEYDLP